MTLPHPNQNKLLKIEALRGFAALYVVLHHTVKFNYSIAGFDVEELLRFGQEAVILFFLLSGFVIHYSFRHTPNMSFSIYFRKRFLRIYVPLIAVFFIGFFTESYNSGRWAKLDWTQLVLNFFMLQDWAFAKPNVITEPVFNNTPLWSLSYEWSYRLPNSELNQFY